MAILSYDTFLDKVHGCWYGKCLGGAAGAPLEGIKRLIDIEDFTEVFNPDLPNDDLDLQLLWLDVLETKGFCITSCDLADAWIEKCWYPFSEYGYFMKNYERGIKPPYSGIINNSFFKEGMGCPIRSEIWGIVCVGNPRLASEYAYIDATLDHSENSVYAEQFLAAVESMAFFEVDIVKLINNGIKYIPNDSKLYNCFDMILSEYHNGTEWKKVRKKVIDKFGHPDFTNVVQNMGFIIISLLYGNGDMRNTINISLQCGYDTDCTCASAASVIGIIKGYSKLGDVNNLINDYFVCGIDVKRQSDSIKWLAIDTVNIAMKMPNNQFGSSQNEKCEDFSLEYERPTPEKLEEALHCVTPVKWDIYGPYFEQFNQEIDKNYPSPHGEGSVLPDLVCMVNNEVFLDKEYELGDKTCTICAYEDLIELDEYITMQGQYACYAQTQIISEKEQTVWAIIGNNDGFSLCVNDEMVLSKDEMRLWTPYNNFCLVNLKKGKNCIRIKLLKRGDLFRFSIGFRIYNGKHWHRSKWCTDLIYV